MSNNSLINLYKDRLLLFSLIVFTFLLYYKSIFNGIINWDDTTFLANNTNIQSFSLYNIVKIFTSPFKGRYQPMLDFLDLFGYKFFGLNPVFYHINNIAFHLINCLLTYWFILLLSKNKFISVFVAFMFAIHPMHSESVLWISDRSMI